MMSITDFLSLLCSQSIELRPESVPLGEAPGRFPSETIASPVDLPPFDLPGRSGGGPGAGKGAYLKAGEDFVFCGRLGPAEIAGLATAGISRVMVRRIVNAGFLTVGDGLVVPGEARGSEERFSPLGHLLMTLLPGAGAWPVDYGILRGGGSALKAVETGLKECPVFIVLGADTVQMQDIFSAPGRELLCDGVAVEGGEELLFGRMTDGEGVSTGFLFSIPSDPVPVFFLFHLFLRPFLFCLNGGDTPGCMLRCLLAEGLERGTSASTGLVPVRLRAEAEGGMLAVPIPLAGPDHVTALIGADGLALLPGGPGHYSPRSPVDVLLFH